MDANELRALQAPVKQSYRDDPAKAMFAMDGRGTVPSEGVTCSVAGWQGQVVAGLHPAAGGDGSEACSGDMLLQALVACAGVTLRAVATAMEIPIEGGTIVAEAEADARGTLGMSKEVPVGLTGIRLRFELDSPAPPEKLQKLVEITERYCVVYQTLSTSNQVSMELAAR